jgi:hypothetical protein
MKVNHGALTPVRTRRPAKPSLGSVRAANGVAALAQLSSRTTTMSETIMVYPLVDRGPAKTA